MSQKAQMTKMAVMIPAMLAARNLDSEDPQIVLLLRIAYISVQAVCIGMLLLARQKSASSISSDVKASRKVWVPGAKGMFDLPDSPRKYSSKIYNMAIAAKFDESIKSACMSVLMTLGLHYYKGMVMGLAIQCVMSPFGLFENSLMLQTLGLGGYVGLESDTKLLEELEDGEITNAQRKTLDAEGNITVTPPSAEGEEGKEVEKIEDDAKPDAVERVKKDASKNFSSSIETLLLDTWDSGADADMPLFLQSISKTNVNYQTRESKWTALMITAGLKASSVTDSIVKLKSTGARLNIVDEEGWTAVHWSVYHNSIAGLQALVSEYDSSDIKECLSMKDKEGKDCRMLAKEEKNGDIEDIIDGVFSGVEILNNGADEGVKQRKGTKN